MKPPPHPRAAEAGLLDAAEKRSDDESQKECNGCRLQADAPLHFVHLQNAADHLAKRSVRQNRQQPQPSRNLLVNDKPCNQELRQRGGNRQRNTGGEAEGNVRLVVIAFAPHPQSKVCFTLCQALFTQRWRLLDLSPAQVLARPRPDPNFFLKASLMMPNAIPACAKEPIFCLSQIAK